MAHVATYTDDRGRVWHVRELVGYDPRTPDPDGFPAIVRAAVIFEADDERRIADDAPLDWHEHLDTLDVLFARARLPETEYGA